MNNDAYSFTPVMSTDLPLLRRWLIVPDVICWWGDPDEQAALLEKDISDPRMVMRMVEFEGRPFAYAQYYDVNDWPQAYFAHLPAGSLAIDTFIGVAEMIGLGHGSAYLRQLVKRLCAEGAPMVVIDPAPDNVRACQAYRKAGFTGDKVVETDEGPAVLMTFKG